MKITSYFCDKCEQPKTQKELTEVVLDLSEPTSVNAYCHTKVELCETCRVELIQKLTSTIEDFFKTKKDKDV